MSGSTLYDGPTITFSGRTQGLVYASVFAFIYLLRGSDLVDQQDGLQRFSTVTLEALLTLMNLDLSGVRKQALPPMSYWASELQNVEAFAEPAVLSSMHQTSTAQNLLPDDAWVLFKATRGSITVRLRSQ